MITAARLVFALPLLLAGLAPRAETPLLIGPPVTATADYAVDLRPIAGEWAWNPAMDPATPATWWMQRDCPDPTSTMLPNPYSSPCVVIEQATRLRGWKLNLSLRANVGVVLACLRVYHPNGVSQRLDCANCGSSGGGCTSTVGADLGNGYVLLQPGDAVSIRMDGYGTPCDGPLAAAWAPTHFCSAPVEIQGTVRLEPIPSEPTQ